MVAMEHHLTVVAVVLLLAEQLLEQEMALATLAALAKELLDMDPAVVVVLVVLVKMDLLQNKMQLLEVTDRQIVS
tara:strand:+ start:17 stop:241 length:225 start_codon:yes stop_codon:yes gene_type:complete